MLIFHVTGVRNLKKVKSILEKDDVSSKIYSMFS